MYFYSISLEVEVSLYFFKYSCFVFQERVCSLHHWALPEASGL